MTIQATLAELETLAKKLSISVVYDSFSGESATRSGGLCKVKGQWRAIIEKRASPAERVVTLARCVARFDIDPHFVSPALREMIEREAAAK